MKTYTLEDGRIVELKGIKKTYNTVWIRSTSPDEAEIKKLSGIIGAPEEDFLEFMKEDERPRLDVARHLQVIYRTPFTEDGDIITVPVSFFIRNNIIITVEKNNVPLLDKLENVVSKNKMKFLFKRNTGYFLYFVLDGMNNEFLKVVDRIAETAEVFKESATILTRKNVEKIYSLNTTLSFFNQALLANIEVLSALRKLYFKPFTPRNKKDFEELYVDALQILDTEKIQREIITNLFNLQSIISTNRLNTLMKRLTVIAVIIMIPTLISGIYGMNIDLPLQQNPSAFLMLVGIMVLICVVLLVFFKLVDWL